MSGIIMDCANVPCSVEVFREHQQLTAKSFCWAFGSTHERFVVISGERFFIVGDIGSISVGGCCDDCVVNVLGSVDRLSVSGYNRVNVVGDIEYASASQGVINSTGAVRVANVALGGSIYAEEVEQRFCDTISSGIILTRNS